MDTTFSTNFEVVDVSSHNFSIRLPHLSSLDKRDDMRTQYPYYNEAALLNLIELHHDTHDSEGRPLSDSIVLTQFSYQFGEHGIYNVLIRDGYVLKNATNPSVIAEVLVTHDPDDSNIPIYVAMGVIFGLAVVWQASTWGYRCGKIIWEERKINREGTDGGLGSPYIGSAPVILIMQTLVFSISSHQINLIDRVKDRSCKTE